MFPGLVSLLITGRNIHIKHGNNRPKYERSTRLTASANSVPVACAGYSSELRCFHASLFSTHVSDCPGKLLAPFPKSTMIHL